MGRKRKKHKKLHGKPLDAPGVPRYEVTCAACKIRFQMKLSARLPRKVRKEIVARGPNLCRHCFSEQKWKEQEPKLTQFAKEHQLPELEGSEAQDHWAQSIRFKCLRRLLSAKRDTPDYAEYERVLLEIARRMTSAHLWIDWEQEGKLDAILSERVGAKLATPSPSEPSPAPQPSDATDLKRPMGAPTVEPTQAAT